MTEKILDVSFEETNILDEHKLINTKSISRPKPIEIKKLLEELDIGTVLLDEMMSEHTTMKVGGPADVFVFVRDISSLSKILPILKKEKIPWMIIGNGSNIIVCDGGIEGVVLSLKKIDNFEILDLEKGIIYADTGLPITKLVRLGIENGFELSWILSGIPATVGGAVRMNAGTRYGEIQQCISSVSLMSLSGELKEINRANLKFSYRMLDIPKDKIVVGATFVFGKGDIEGLKKLHKEAMQYRSSTQPLTYPSCGSVFKNPVNVNNGKINTSKSSKKAKSAGYLIEASGLKGVRIHGAQISEKHANWIVNVGDAKSSDIMSLIRLIKEKVKQDHNINLELEVKVVGRQ